MRAAWMRLVAPSLRIDSDRWLRTVPGRDPQLGSDRLGARALDGARAARSWPGFASSADRWRHLPERCSLTGSGWRGTP